MWEKWIINYTIFEEQNGADMALLTYKLIFYKNIDILIEAIFPQNCWMLFWNFFLRGKCLKKKSTISSVTARRNTSSLAKVRDTIRYTIPVLSDWSLPLPPQNEEKVWVIFFFTNYSSKTSVYIGSQFFFHISLTALSVYFRELLCLIKSTFSLILCYQN